MRPFLCHSVRANFSPAEAAGNLELHAVGASGHACGDGFLDGAAERYAAFELERDALGHEVRDEVGLLDFLNVDEHVFAEEFGQIRFEGFEGGALLPYHDARAGGVDFDADALAGRAL